MSILLPRKKSIISVLLAIWLTGVSISASAGSFSVSPVRFYMAPKERATSVTITNTGDDALVMQADVYAWRQTPDGVDELTLTEDIFLSPPIIKLDAKARQVVRLAQLTPVAANAQRYYRMIIREIPEARPPQAGIEVQLATAFSLPIFISPTGLKSQLVCQAERIASGDTKAVCENLGNAYVLLGEIALKNAANESVASFDTLGYILPGVKRSFELKSTQGKIPAGKFRLEVTLDDGTTPNFAIELTD